MSDLCTNSINVSQKTLTIGYYLDEIVEGRLRLRDEKIKITSNRDSSLIIAVLLGIPMPQVCVDERTEPYRIRWSGDWLWAFIRLVKNQRVVQNTIEELQEINGLVFSQWSEKWQRKLRGMPVASVHINEGMPSEDANYCYFAMSQIYGNGYDVVYSY
jgi:hypothetical protein